MAPNGVLRQHSRHPVTLDAIVVALGTRAHLSTRLAGRLFDLSRGGFGIALTQKLHLGTTAMVHVKTPGLTVVEPAEVRSVRHADGCGYLTGFRLLHTPPSLQMAELVERVRNNEVA